MAGSAFGPELDARVTLIGDDGKHMPVALNNVTVESLPVVIYGFMEKFGYKELQVKVAVLRNLLPLRVALDTYTADHGYVYNIKMDVAAHTMHVKQ